MHRMEHFPAIGESHCVTVKLLSRAIATNVFIFFVGRMKKGLIMKLQALSL